MKGGNGSVMGAGEEGVAEDVAGKGDDSSRPGGGVGSGDGCQDVKWKKPRGRRATSSPR